MKDTVDILVVGLGPAGASAAREAARAGCSVLAVDRRQAAGEPVQCAEFVPRLIGQHVPGVAPARVQPVEAMHTFVEAAACDRADGFTGSMIDRCRFDALLVEQARQAGAECRFGTVWHPGFDVRARLAIGADGPRSRLRAAAGLPQPRLIETRQIAVPLHNRHRATDIFLSAGIEGGYGWLFPKGATANLGIGVVPAARRQLKPMLERLRRRLVAEGRIGDAILGHTGGAIPVSGTVGPTGRLPDGTPVLLAGDAAGLTNPVTGAGIPAAVMSGALAGEAATRWIAGAAEAPGDYADEIEDLFGASLRRAVCRRQELARTAAAAGVQPADLRRSWIAFPEYWAARPAPPNAMEAA